MSASVSFGSRLPTAYNVGLFIAVVVGEGVGALFFSPIGEKGDSCVTDQLAEQEMCH